MQIKVFIKRRLAVILCLVCLLVPQMQVMAAGIEKQQADKRLAGYVLAEKSGNLELYYHPDEAHILVKDCQNGYIWDSALPEEQIPENSTDVQRQEMKSLLSLTYSAADYFSSETSNSSLENKEYQIKTEDLEDGFAYQIYIPDFDFQIKIEFILNAYGVEVRIPEDGIVECVESGEKVKSLCQELAILLQARKDTLTNVQEDDAIPNSLMEDVDSAITILDEMMETLNGIEEPFGIGSISEALTEQLEEVFSLLIGTSAEKGFYQNLLLSEDMDESVKTAYRQEMQLWQTFELTLKIKLAQLKEVPAITLVRVKLLPYFGAAGDTQEGYMLYPDGCGAITYFKENHGSYSSMYEADTYSSLSPDIDWEESKDALGLDNVAIPYFGIHNGENACIAYVTGGNAQSTITFAPSGYVVNVNRIGAEFTYRQTVATASISGVWQSGADVMVFEREIQPFTAAIQYGFLAGEEADYSGMVNFLRDYMDKEGILEKSESVETDTLPLALDLFGGYKENVLAFDKYEAGTTFAQAKKIIESFEEIPILCNYKGVFEEGYSKYPSEYNTVKNLGSEAELNVLSEEVQNSGGQLFLESNQLLADYDESGYSEGELAISNRYQILNNEEKTQHLFSPETLETRFDEIISENMNSYTNVGLTELMMGSFVYADYSEKHSSTRTETIETYQDILNKIKEQQGAVAVNSGSDYTFSETDWLRNVPSDVSGYIYTDETVPFYMMLVHGYMNYTSLPNNQFYDKEVQTLKAIEYGFLPYYSLTAEDIDLGSTGVYVSKFEDIYEDMVDTYNVYVEVIGDLMNEPITNHFHEGDIAVVEYENGVKIIINYSDTKATVEGIDVGPLSFARTKKGEVTKIEAKEIEAFSESESKGISVYSSLVIWLSVLLLVSIVIFGGVSFFNRHRS